MATLHPPTVDGPPAAPPTSAEDPVQSDQQWPQSSHGSQIQPSNNPQDVATGEEEQLYGRPDLSANDNTAHDTSTHQHQSNPSNADLLPQSGYPPQRHHAVQQLAHQQQFHHQSYNQSGQDPNVAQSGSGGSLGSGGGGGGGGSGSNAGSKIFVGGLSWETDEESLRRYFEQIGPVTDCVIMRDRHTGHPRGFGFVTFEHDDAAGAAASRRHDLDGRQVEAKRAVPRNEGGGGGGGGMSGGGTAPAGGNVFGAGPRGGNQQHAGSRFGSEMGGGGGGGGGQGLQGGGGHRGHHTTKCKVFVGGLPSSCGADEFRGYFSQYGEVVDAQVMIDHNTGNSRGFGFVTFANEATVSTVVGPGKSNTDHEIMGKSVEVKRAEPKGAPSERRNNRDSYNAGDAGAGLRGGAAGNDSMSGTANGGGTNAAAAAAAAYYSNYPASLAEQYGAYYQNPQWQQYYAAMGYNFNAYPQGYNPYQQYLQAYMNTAGAANGGSSGMASNVSGDVAANTGTGTGAGAGAGAGAVGSGVTGYENNQGPPAARYGSGSTGGDMAPGAQNGHGGGGQSGSGPGSRRSSRREDRYHPYR